MAYPPDYIKDLRVVYNDVDKIDITTGRCRDDADTEDIIVTSTLTLDIDDSGANGLDTGTVANSTLYFVWVIKNTSTDAEAGLFSISNSNPTMPSGYTVKRLVGFAYIGSGGEFDSGSIVSESDGPLPARFIDRIEMDYASASTVTISQGRCRSSDFTSDIHIPATFTIDITSSGANGLDTGSEANSTWYNVFAILDSSSGATAGLLSTSLTPTLPGSYDKYRWVGAIYNNSSGNLFDVYSTGHGPDREFRYTSPDVFTFNSGTKTEQSFSAYAPTTAKKMRVFFYTSINATNTHRYTIWSDVDNATEYARFHANGATAPSASMGELNITMTTSQSVWMQRSLGNGTQGLGIRPLGFTLEL